METIDHSNKLSLVKDQLDVLEDNNQARYEDLVRRFERLEKNQKEELKMDQEILDVIKAIDDATNGVATRMQTLIDQINAGKATTAEIVAALTPEVTKLKGLAADPNNPVP